jgi:CubicO group peptidase (beta-lactamase class C family)
VAEALQRRIERVEAGLTGEVIAAEGSKVHTWNLAGRMKHHRVNGLSVAVINGGAVEWAKAYGVADAGTREPVTPQTLFQTASVGKMITALAALQLVKAGRIGLDEDVNRKLTSWQVPENEFTAKEKVTLRRLLSHSAGFTDDYGFAGYAPGGPLPTLRQMLDARPPANHTKPLVPGAVPGTVVRYSGGGYLVVQQLVEDLTGRPFAAYVEAEIFRKLGLAQSTYHFYPDRELARPVARGHYGNGKVYQDQKYRVYPEAAAAGCWSTPSELARLLIQLVRERNGGPELLLDRALAETMLTPQFEFNDRALGVVLQGARQVDGFGHAGNNAGYNSLVFATTATGQGAVIMVNSDEGIALAQELMRSIANEYKWPFGATRTVRRLSPESQGQYLGTYQVADTGRGEEKLWVKVGRGRQGLTAQLSNPAATVRLYRTEENAFILKEAADALQFTFSPGSTGRMETLTLHKYGGARLVLRRAE